MTPSAVSLVLLQVKLIKIELKWPCCPELTNRKFTRVWKGQEPDWGIVQRETTETHKNRRYKTQLDTLAD